MVIDDLVGRPLGPFAFQATPERSSAFVEATGDDEARWAGHPPPGFVAAPMFAAAAPFLAHEAVTTEAPMVLHTEQRFQWHQPFPIDSGYQVDGVLARIRRRGPMTFVSLDIDVRQEDGGPLANSASTFLMMPPADSGPAPSEEAEPAPDARAANARPTLVERGEAIPDLLKSASRADLVRYAAASGDWNPIHWDHQSAVAAGLPGVICHGLLMAAWITQAAAQATRGAWPLREARLRFRQPLRPAVPAIVTTTVTSASDGAPMTFELESAGTTLVTATVTSRSE